MFICVVRPSWPRSVLACLSACSEFSTRYKKAGSVDVLGVFVCVCECRCAVDGFREMCVLPLSIDDARSRNLRVSCCVVAVPSCRLRNHRFVHSSGVSSPTTTGPLPSPKLLSARPPLCNHVFLVALFTFLPQVGERRIWCPGRDGFRRSHPVQADGPGKADQIFHRQVQHRPHGRHCGGGHELRQLGGVEQIYAYTTSCRARTPEIPHSTKKYLHLHLHFSDFLFSS